MTAYRRLRRPGGTYFFTVALADRRASYLTDRIDTLRAVYAETLRKRPVRTDAIVILPDHLHAIWTLPAGESDFSTRWRLIKSRFVRASGLIGPRSASKRGKAERGVWQRRFWEHAIRDQADMNLHLRYCRLNPVKHGLVSRAADWPWSSLHRDIARGLVDPEIAGEVPEGEFGEVGGRWVRAPILRFADAAPARQASQGALGAVLEPARRRY
jgi:putative transposase